MKCCSYADVWHTREPFYSHRLGLCEKLSPRIIQTQQRDSRCSSCPVRNPLFSWSCGTTHPYVVLQSLRLESFSQQSFLQPGTVNAVKSLAEITCQVKRVEKICVCSPLGTDLAIMSVSFRNLAIGIQNNRLYENHWMRMLEKQTKIDSICDPGAQNQA